MTRRIVCGLALLSGVVASLGAQGAAPTGRCQFEYDQIPTAHLSSVKLPSGSRNSYIGGGVIARCPKQQIVLKSDSLEQYGDEGRTFFIGHVDYKDMRLKLKSDFLTYFQKDDRILAVSNMTATLPNGSTLVGPSLEFFRAIPKVRPVQRGIAIQRPTASLIDKDAQGKPQPPVNVTGNTIWLTGDSLVSAQGSVIVLRPQLTATGDSLYLDKTKGLVRMMVHPKIVGTKDRPFTLVGETIDLLSKNDKLERVLAKNAADAISEDLHLASDTIDMRVSDDRLQRAYAWGKHRAKATSAAQDLTSDSIYVVMPDQRVREMHAIRGATADAMPDTIKTHTAEKDRLTGDTIIAYFDSIPARDTTSKPTIRRVVSTGNATLLQHLAPQDTTLRVAAQNYTTGERLTVFFDSVGKVKTFDVVGKTGGVYIEPESDSTRKAKAAPKAGAPAGGKTPPATTVPKDTTGVLPAKPTPAAPVKP